MSASLERWRSYLLLLSRVHLRDAAEKVDASDIVQEVLLDAHRQADLYRGNTDAERAAWLRKLLAGKVADAWRRLHADKRDIDRERSIEAAVEESSARFERFLAADQSSPSEKAERNEQLARLADAMALLPEGQRQALECRHLLGWSIDTIAGQMNKTPTAVAGLLKRGLQQLRAVLQE